MSEQIAFTIFEMLIGPESNHCLALLTDSLMLFLPLIDDNTDLKLLQKLVNAKVRQKLHRLCTSQNYIQKSQFRS